MTSSGELNGMGYYAADPANARMIEYLSDAPFGIILEKVYEEPPIDTGIYGSFARKPDVVGIPWVLRVWQRNLPDLPHVVDAVGEFYSGKSEDPGAFLIGQNVRYVVWSPRESADTATWQTIDASIREHYRWIEFSADPQKHVGLWERVSVAQ